jgi:SAM-dependent methyltransferase
LKHTALARVLNVLQCPYCRTGRPATSNGGGPAAPLACQACGTGFPFRKGYLDLCPDYSEKVTPIQHLLQFPPMIAIYDNIWRPFGYFITSDRSFPKDLQRITEWIEPKRHRLVLDLACGPGNFTRSIASSGKDTAVVGFDLARQMLERAVRLTPETSFSNVCYLRGDALGLPFESGSFDAVVCCGALQLFTNYDRALAEISRVLRVGGEFVCQTIVGPKATPLWLRMADRVMKFGYFHYDDLTRRLSSLRLNIVDEESSKVSFIFRAAKAS